MSAAVFPLGLATADAPQQLIEETRRRGWTIDTLVNNAGSGTYGPFAEADVVPMLPLKTLQRSDACDGR